MTLTTLVLVACTAIAFIIGAAIGFMDARRRTPWSGDRPRNWKTLAGDILTAIGHGLFASLFGFCAGLMIVVGAMVIVPFFEECRFSEQVQLKAADDGTAIHASFFLFGGSMNSVDGYRFYYMSDICGPSGSSCVRSNFIPAHDSVIIEEDRSDGILLHYARCGELTRAWGFRPTEDCNPTWIFRVPKGSVTNQINFDLK